MNTILLTKYFYRVILFDGLVVQAVFFGRHFSDFLKRIEKIRVRAKT